MRFHNIYGIRLSLIAIIAGSTLAAAQQPAVSQSAGGDEITALRGQLQATRQQLSETQDKLRELSSVVADLQRQMASLKPELASTAELPTPATAPDYPASTQAASAAPPATQTPARITQDEWQLLNEKVEEQEQTKVSSASKFRLKLSGMMLLNVFGNDGYVDEIDLPRAAWARPPAAASGSFGASLRQSIVSLTGYGPELFGARTSADLQVDFFGGLPNGYSGYSSGLARLRLARMRFDWDKTSVVGGLDYLFFSPNSPTSYASVAEPALASAGNLWSWTPTLRVEHRLDTASVLWKFEGGILDYSGYTGYYTGYRSATPGESSRQPAYAIRISGNGRSEDHPVSFGVAGVLAPQRFPGGNDVNGWGGLLDWKTPVAPHLELSGEFFAGKGLAGFGGFGLNNFQNSSYLYMARSAPTIAKLSSVGGWSQLKFRVNERNEFNVAGGYSGLKSFDLRAAATFDPNLAGVPAKNESLMVNYIFRPRSDLVFSLEYRRLRTMQALEDTPYSANHVGASAGFIF
jgi:hypothetical protein